MKKYKLIKWYPSLPGSWKSKEVIVGIKPDSHYYNQEILSMGAFSIRKDNVENNPEYWEEVKELEYDILEFKQDKKPFTIYLSLKENGNYGTSQMEGGFTLHQMLEVGDSVKNGKLLINKIKRISDGVVFTVGDRITGKTFKEGRLIIDFAIINGELEVHQSGGYSELKNIQHCKEPLCVTEDGVKIWEQGTKIYLVGSDFDYCGEMEFDMDICYTSKLFSTEQAAKEYIEKNKPKPKLKEWYGVNIEEWHTFSFMAHNVGKLSCNHKIFETAKERDQYIKENKKMYTEADMISFCKYLRHHTMWAKSSEILEEWIKLNKV